MTYGTRLLDRLSLPTTFITMRLNLLIHPRRNHMFLNHNAPTPTLIARLNNPIRRPGPFTRFANLLLFNTELQVSARVEVTQR